MGGRDNSEKTILPPREEFYSYLKDEGVSENDYAHHQKIWNKFNIKNMRVYHDLYLTLDVLLFADVFENFHRISLNFYLLDPCRHYTLQGIIPWTQKK